MNPLEIKIQELETRLANIESAANPSFTKELERRLQSGQITIETGAALTNMGINVRNSADTGSESVADNYTGALNLYSNGVLIGRIGYY